VECWGPGEKKQLKVLYDNTGSLVFLQSAHQAAVFPSASMAEAWKGGGESAVISVKGHLVN